MSYQVPHYEKTNHHFVPQHWQKRFRDANNQLWVREVVDVEIRGTNRTMTSDDTYTTFDEWFRPSDALEDAFAREEGPQSQFIARLIQPGYQPTEDDKEYLCEVLAIQAVRHPDVMGSGYRMARRLAKAIGNVKNMSKEAFVMLLRHGDLPKPALEIIYEGLTLLPQEELDRQVAEIDDMSPHDPRLPHTEAILGWPIVCEKLKNMSFELLDAPVGYSYVLCDTPLPQDQLQAGFTVPLSKSVAVRAKSPVSGAPSITRLVAKPLDVWEINQDQWNRHKAVIVGCDPQLLRNLKTEDRPSANYQGIPSAGGSVTP